MVNENKWKAYSVCQSTNSIQFMDRHLSHLIHFFDQTRLWHLLSSSSYHHHGLVALENSLPCVYLMVRSLSPPLHLRRALHRFPYWHIDNTSQPQHHTLLPIAELTKREVVYSAWFSVTYTCTCWVCRAWSMARKNKIHFGVFSLIQHSFWGFMLGTQTKKTFQDISGCSWLHDL